MHTQYLSKRSVITHCLTQRRSNQGVFLCRIIFTFMCLWGNWAASVESWLWASIETMNKLCIIVLQHMRRTYFRGLSSDLVMAGRAAGSHHGSVWFHVLGDSPPVMWWKRWCHRMGHARGWAELLQGKAGAAQHRPCALHLPHLHSWVLLSPVLS